MSYKNDQNYLSATEQEKKWFDSFYETRSPLEATKAAYRVSSDESAQAYAKKVMERVHMKALITDYMMPKPSLPTPEDLKRLYIEISNDANATPRDKLAALAAYERLCGFVVKGKPTNQAPEDDPLADIED